MRGKVTAVRLATVALLWTCPSYADDSSTGVSLLWHAPSTCPNQREVEARLTQLLALDLADFYETSRVQADVQQLPDSSWALNLTIDNAHGKRHKQLKHPSSCTPLANAAVLVIAIALDPNVGAPAAEAGLTDAAPAVQPRPVVAVAAKVDDQTPTTGRGALPDSAHVVLRLQAGAAAGELPRPGPLFGGATSVVFARLRVEGHFDYLPTQRKLTTSLATAGADFGLWVAGLRICPTLPVASEVELLLCFGGELGQLRATGVGLDAARKVRELWAAPVLAPSLRWPKTSSWSAMSGLEVILPLHRSEFFVEHEGVLHRPSAIGLRFLVGLELDVP